MAANIAKIESACVTLLSPVNQSQMRNKSVLPKLQPPQLAKMIVLTSRRCLNRTLGWPVVLILWHCPHAVLWPAPGPDVLLSRTLSWETSFNERLYYPSQLPFFFKNKVFRLFELKELQRHKLWSSPLWFYLVLFFTVPLQIFSLVGRCYVMHMSHDLHLWHE